MIVSLPVLLALAVGCPAGAVQSGQSELDAGIASLQRGAIETASETFAQKGDAYGIPLERVDGNDIFAVYEACKRAVDRARAGDGPTFVECVTYRIVEHNTADEPTVYRNDEQLEYWLERGVVPVANDLLHDLR